MAHDAGTHGHRAHDHGAGSDRVPTVIGPITGSQPPFGLPRRDLDAIGYIAEEFQIDGSARAFRPPDGTEPSVDGRWAAEAFGEAPYRTRLLVVRPVDPERFSGTVTVNWQNVSAGFETGGASSDELFDGGHAWVGVSAQEVGVYGFAAGMGRRMAGLGVPLVAHDPERYSALRHPGDLCSFDIFTQAGLTLSPLRRSGDDDPLGGLTVQRLIATGASQSAMRLAAYLNALHHEARVYDGFLLSVWEGRAPLLTDGTFSIPMRTTIRDDIDEPVLIVNSEFEAASLAQIGVVDGPRRRVWEVTGTPHAVAPMHSDRPDDRGRVINRLTYKPVYDAALRAVHRWLAEGIEAPHQPRIEMDETGASPRRDEFGNALGGIRLPEIDAPTFEYRASAFGTGRAPLFGAARPFTHDELRSLYRSRDEFITRWETAVEVLVASGAVRKKDAETMVQRAASMAPAFE